VGGFQPLSPVVINAFEAIPYNRTTKELSPNVGEGRDQAAAV